MIVHRRHASAIGEVLLVGTDDGVLHGLYLPTQRRVPADPGPERPGALDRVACELDEYLAGERRTFTVPVDPVGTPFQREVWAALTAIPYGATTTYASLAARLGRPRGVRAVGAANGRNPISIIIPCHRVVGTDGALTGYGGGLERKAWLLALERRRL